jgi:hypothetical protein
MKKTAYLLAFAWLLAFRLAAQTFFSLFGCTWKYRDNGVGQRTAWQAVSFHDGT